MTDHDEDEYVPKRDRRLLVRFVLLFVLALVCVVVGFDFLAGFRVGRFVAAGFGTVTESGSTGDGGVSPDVEEVPSPATVE